MPGLGGAQNSELLDGGIRLNSYSNTSLFMPRSIGGEPKIVGDIFDDEALVGIIELFRLVLGAAFGGNGFRRRRFRSIS